MFSNAEVGDTVIIESSINFCEGGSSIVNKIQTRYNSKTGEPYKIITTEYGKFRADNGSMFGKRSPYYIDKVIKK